MMRRSREKGGLMRGECSFGCVVRDEHREEDGAQVLHSKQDASLYNSLYSEG